jgi:hypothetical protein
MILLLKEPHSLLNISILNATNKKTDKTVGLLGNYVDSV